MELPRPVPVLSAEQPAVRPPCSTDPSTTLARFPHLSLLCLAGLAAAALALGCEPADDLYVQRAASPHGSGRVYMGREIAAPTDSAEIASWLEHPARADADFPDRLVQALDLAPSDVVADIGAGTGFYTFRLSPRVPYGRVLAVDVQPEMLDHLRARIRRDSIGNVVPVLGTPTDPNLPAGTVDVALIVAAYHEFTYPREMMEAVAEALRPGGQVVLVEYRGEDPTIPLPAERRMTVEQARREMEAVGLTLRETRDFLPQQHFMVFEKPGR